LVISPAISRIFPPACCAIPSLSFTQ
jgi:hypothetical protein